MITYSGGQVTSEFAYCIFVILAAALQHQRFGNNVGAMRKKHGITYPRMYADAGRNDGTLLRQLTEDDANEFNRYQRVHQNNSEIMATFFVMMAIAGVGFPVYATIGGLIWVIGRGVYALGYYSSTEKRIYGGFFHAGEIMLLVLCILFGVFLLMKKDSY